MPPDRLVRKTMLIAGIVSKKNMNISDRIVEMLSTMKHTENSFTGLALNDEVIVAEKLDPYNLSGARASMAIGCCGLPIEGKGVFPQPLKDCSGTMFLVGTGRIYNFDELRRSINSHTFETIVHMIEEESKEKHHNLFESVLSILPRLNGVFSFAVLRRGTMVVARDLLGVEALYWGEDEDYFAFASERKALWKIGINRVTAFPSGYVASIEQREYVLSKALTLRKPEVLDISLDIASQKLKEVLQQAFKTCLKGVDEVGILFSGGIDSSLVVKIAGDMGIRSTLYTAGMEGAYDIEIAEKSAAELGYNHSTRIIPLSKVEEYIYKIVYAIEEANVMKIGVGFPLYASAELANAHGIGILLSGQGSDELFGGYAKYLGILREYGREKLDEGMWNDVLRIAEVNLQRDSAIAMINNIEQRLPFLDLRVVNLAMSFPTQFKVSDPMDKLRKHVLRKTAKLFGLPESIVNLPKKAAQHGSGSDKALRKLARMRGYKLPYEYVEAVFRDVFKDFLFL